MLICKLCYVYLVTYCKGATVAPIVSSSCTAVFWQKQFVGLHDLAPGSNKFRVEGRFFLLLWASDFVASLSTPVLGVSCRLEMVMETVILTRSTY